MPNSIKVKAVYRGGSLVPFKRINLDEGEKVDIEIKMKKSNKNISLRGLWKGAKVKEEDVEKVKFIWEQGLKNQIEILQKD